MDTKRDYLQIIEREKKERTGRLNLGNCGLEDWPAELFELTWLTHLVMGDDYEWNEQKKEFIENDDVTDDFANSINDISPKLSELKNLQYLNCDGVDIEEIENVGAISSLSSLVLSNNNISKIEGIDKLLSLTILDLSYNAITELQALSKLTTLNRLNLAGNTITGITPLSKLTALTHLDLSGNEIIEIESIGQLLALNYLDLSANEISGVEAIAKLTGLNHLNLSGSMVNDLKALTQLGHLTFLSLADNELREIKVPYELKALTQLDLSGNIISEIKSLDPFTNLTNLDLSHNNISEIKGLDQLIGLTRLNLSRNQLSEIKGLDRLINLKELNLSFNQIPQITNLDSLVNLASLNLSQTKITEIKGLSQLISLDNLSLYRNKISEIKGLDKLSGLREMDLSDNQIVEIKALDQLISLTELDLSLNRITEIKGLDKLASLKKLDLSTNEIKEIKALGQLTAISELILYSNQIAKIEGLDELITLTSLDLSRNQITEIEGLDQLANLKKLILVRNKVSYISKIITHPTLTHLEINGNPTKDFPKALHEEFDSDENCLPDLKIWLAELEKGNTIKNKQAKMFLVGNGNTGKSSIVEALKYGKCSTEKKSTNGILIEQWNPDEKRHFNIWDFGGQEIYHGTNRLFMNSEGIRLIVFDPETEQNNRVRDRINKDEIIRNHSLDYWIENVKDSYEEADNYYDDEEDHQENSTVIIVQNKADKSPEINKTANNLAIDNGFKFVQVSATAGKNIDELIFQVNKLLPVINEYDMEIPGSWDNIRNYYLAEQKKANIIRPVIKLSEFQQTASEYSVDERVFSTVLKFLHNNGIVYYNKQYMEDNVIVDQRWALDAIYKILERDSAFYRLQRTAFKGLCQLEHIWDAWGKEISDESKRLLLQFMRNCAICFPLNDTYYDKNFSTKQTYVFPEFLNSEKSQVVKNQEETVKNSFYYYRLQKKYLSYRTVQQIIVEYGTKTPFEYIWRNGILLKVKNSFCCIEGDFDKNILSIGIDKKLEKSFLPELLQKVNIGYGRAKEKWEKSEDAVVYMPLPDEMMYGSFDREPKELASVKQHSVLKIAISYAKEEDDKDGRIYGFNPVQELIDNLSILESENKIRLFYDKNINENDWDRQIRNEFTKADLIIVLNSVSYNKADKRYIWEVEKPIIEEKLKETKLSVIRINVSDCLTRDFVNGINAFKQNELPKNRQDRDKFFRDFIKEQIQEKVLKN